MNKETTEFFDKIHAQVSELIGERIPETIGKCHKCREELPSIFVFVSYDQDFIYCPNCDAKIFYGTVYDPLTREKFGDKFSDLLPGQHKGRLWHHCTFVENWDACLANGVLPETHCGTRFTAFDRIFSIFNEDWHGEDYYQVTLRLRDDAVFAGISDDKNSDWEEIDLASGEYCSYVNEHEGLGDVSLFCSPDVLEVVSIEKRNALTDLRRLEEIIDQVASFSGS